MPRRYDILALDLDGTLLTRDGRVSDANRAALHRARAEGLRIVVCTGRGWLECRHILAQIEQVDPVVVAGGSIVARAHDGMTLHRFSMHQSLVHRAVDALLAHQQPALLLKDSHAAGYDYLVVQGQQRRAIDPVMDWWFQTMRVQARFLDDVRQDEHPEHTVRVGACARAGTLDELESDLRAALGDQALIHNFPAVVSAAHAREGIVMCILEVFDAAANKWEGVSHVAQQLGVAPQRIAAIGDQINDEAMIAQAGLGIAMGNATPHLRALAARTTHTNDEDGVAHAIDQMLTGAW
jgi:5-amino-6-(5-phospho-D-ribitylamino)uracil phosphatase